MLREKAPNHKKRIQDSSSSLPATCRSVEYDPSSEKNMMNSTEGQAISENTNERAQKIARLKRQVQAGDYQVDSLALADRMLNVGIIEDDKSFIH